MASSYTCRPVSDYSNYGFLLYGGTSLWGCLTSEDDATSFIEASQPSRYYHALLDKPAVGVCYSSTFSSRLKGAGGYTPDVQHGTSVAGVFKDTDTYTLGGSWATDSFSLTPLPGDVNSTSFGGGIQVDGTTNPTSPQCSWFKLELSYDPPTGQSYAYLIGSFLGPLVAVGLQEMPGLVRYFNAEAARRPWWHPWNRHRLGLEDCERMWRALVEARGVAYSIP